MIAVLASQGCSNTNRAMPSTAPSRALTTASTEEMMPICRDVAPTEPQRGVALLPPGGGQPGGGADQDEDREHERDRADDECVAEVVRPDLPPWRGGDPV